MRNVFVRLVISSYFISLRPWIGECESAATTTNNFEHFTGNRVIRTYHEGGKIFVAADGAVSNGFHCLGEFWLAPQLRLMLHSKLFRRRHLKAKPLETEQ